MRNTLRLIAEGSITLSFMSYPYPMLRPVVVAGHLDLADIADIGCMKLSAITGRGTTKDYVDLYFNLQRFTLNEVLAKAVQGLGPDVELAAKKTYVSVRRKKQFAILQPSTKTRFDLGIQLKGHPGVGRLEAGGAFNGMTTHRVALGQGDGADPELTGWLREAYEAAG